MKKLANGRSIWLLAWIIVTVVITLLMPDMDVLVREKGQASVPATTQSEIAKSMLNQMDDSGTEKYDIIAVFNSGSAKPLTANQEKQINAVVEQLKNKEKELGIQKIVSHLDSEETKDQLVSEDQSTILTQISVDKTSGTITEVADKLNPIVHIEGVKSYLTGNDLVLEDFVQSTQEGIKKTEVIAIVFILVVLILVFRSPIVPLVSLTTVGVSYLVSMGIIAQLVDHFNYPFSNFTQVFLVVILFGIGTDYNILLFTRFKEELSRQSDVNAAIKDTYKSAGRTVLYSGLAVFIGFMALILAEFKIYRSSSAVAIGVAVLILVLNTLNPFFMALLGKKMFWPSKRFEGHGDSRTWGLLAKHAVRRPFAALVIVAVLCVPFVMKYSDVLSYNDLLEVDDSYASKQGINVIEDHFSPGFSSPATVVVKSDHTLDNSESLQALDELADKISKVDGVASVYTVTRPTGKKIDELYISDQTGELNSGLDEAATGIDKINGGLSSAEEQLNGTDSSSLADVQKLIDGTSAMKQGAAELQTAMNQVTQGINSGADGAKNLKSGLATVETKLDTLSKATGHLVQGYNQLESGLSPFTQYFTTIGQSIEGAKAGYEQIEATMSSFVKEHPEMASDQNVQTTLAIAASGKTQLGELSAKLNQLIPQYTTAMSSFKQANTSLQQVQGGLGQLEKGIAQLGSGATKLESGLKEGAAGSAQIAGKTKELETGLTSVNNGQQQLLNGLTDLEGKMTTLKSGLSESTSGLDKVSSGLADAQEYLASLSGSEAAKKFYIPQDVLQGEDFQKSVDMYMSNDRTTARLMVILKVNPYTKEAMDIVGDLNKQVSGALEGTDLGDAKVAIGGKSSQNADLQDMASGDFARTAVIMLVGIGLVLILITRSFWQPVFIVASLLLAYGTSLGLSEFIGTRILDVDNLGWNVPFFSFIMIVALGVDYSIFLMMRYRENGEASNNALVDAARHMGGVVISAAIILSGTFAALMPSGVLTLIEVAISVILGLLILSLIMLPVFIPALISVSHKLSGKSAKEE
ncbi:MMPL family transporter [Paenibacillus sp. HN-1]|uniref:MMPL family transporter n=1 Tax=Paenibacillus TaxID=44249 RepID=UPI001CA81A94|nr:MULTISPECIES: MMPL family transporter [Paenibacillus]MBY9079943.1 MMPL family transporter [Paenibacillus sp. CGMCC 1.18879]MBY9084585.1 MMPL family transporter [Paenibacillus sinensis]